MEILDRIFEKRKSGSYHSRYPDAWYDRSGITGADTKGRNIGCVFCYSSGYAEFDYARRAMQNKCTEYLLKPVDRETLLKLLHKVRALSDRERQESKAHEEMEHA